MAAKTTTDLITRYRDEIAHGRRGSRWELTRCNKLLRSPLAGIPLDQFTSTQFDKYLESLLGQGLMPNSVIREASVIRAMFKHAVGWGWIENNVTLNAITIKPNEGRDLILTPLEIQAMRDSFGVPLDDELEWFTAANVTQELGVFFLIALETGCRMNELVLTDQFDLDLVDGIHIIPRGNARNGQRRTIPLSEQAVVLWGCLEPRADGVFTDSTPSTMSTTFRKHRIAANLKRTITFNDSRHTALTNLAKRYDIMDLAQISGLRNPYMLLEYYPEISRWELQSMLREQRLDQTRMQPSPSHPGA